MTYMTQEKPRKSSNIRTQMTQHTTRVLRSIHSTSATLGASAFMELTQTQTLDLLSTSESSPRHLFQHVSTSFN